MLIFEKRVSDFGSPRGALFAEDRVPVQLEGIFLEMFLQKQEKILATRILCFILKDIGSLLLRNRSHERKVKTTRREKL